MSDSTKHILSALKATSEAQSKALVSYEEFTEARRRKIEELRQKEIDRIKAQAEQDIRFTNELFWSLQKQINEVSDDVYSFYRLFHFEDLPRKGSLPKGTLPSEGYTPEGSP